MCSVCNWLTRRPSKLNTLSTAIEFHSHWNPRVRFYWLKADVTCTDCQIKVMWHNSVLVCVSSKSLNWSNSKKKTFLTDCYSIPQWFSLIIQNFMNNQYPTSLKQNQNDFPIKNLPVLYNLSVSLYFAFLLSPDSIFTFQTNKKNFPYLH